MLRRVSSFLLTLILTAASATAQTTTAAVLGTVTDTQKRHSPGSP
jgi:hypothetical protein